MSLFFNPSRPDMVSHASEASSGDQRDQASEAEYVKDKVGYTATNHTAQDGTTSDVAVDLQTPPVLWERYKPLDEVGLALRPLAERRNDELADIWLAVGQGARELAWSAFVPHMRGIWMADNRDVTAMPNGLFDSLFWLIASEGTVLANNDDEVKAVLVRHEEIFNRIRILFEYAETLKLEPTTLQIRRLAYMWITLWEQHARRKMDFRHTDYQDTIKRILQELDGPLISRFVSRLAAIDHPSDAQQIILQWRQRLQDKKTRRVEAWVIDGKEIGDEVVQETLLASDTIDSLALQDVLDSSRRVGDSPETRKIIFFVLQQENVHLHDGRSKVLRRIIHPTHLWSYLPDSVREEIEQSGNDDTLLRLSSKTNSSAAKIKVKLDAKARDRLFLPIAFAITQQGDLRVAEWLLRHNDEVGRPNAPLAAGLADLFAGATQLLACRSREDGDRTRALERLYLALRFFEQGEWYQARQRSFVHREIIRALQRFIVQKDGFALLPADRWRGIVQRLTVMILTSDPTLDTLHDVDGVGFPNLLALHIALRDYQFAIRLFMLHWSRHGHDDVSPFRPYDFVWLFNASLEQESTIHTSTRILVHWMTSDLSSERVPQLPQTIIRRYAQRLVRAKRIDQVIMMQEFLSLEPRSSAEPGKKTLSMPNQARRWIKVFCSLTDTYMDDILPIFERFLSFFRAEKRGILDAHIIDLHGIVLRRLRPSIASLDALQRARALRIFGSFREYSLEALKNASQVGREQMRKTLDTRVSSVYRVALSILRKDLAEEDKAEIEHAAPPRGSPRNMIGLRIEALLDDMELAWLIDLAKVDVNGPHRPITSSKILALVARESWKEAHQLYTNAMQSYAQEMDRRKAFREATGEEDGELDDIDARSTGQGSGHGSTAKEVRIDEKLPNIYPIPVTLASRLALALGRAGLFAEANDVLAVYSRCALQGHRVDWHDEKEPVEGQEDEAGGGHPIDGGRSSQPVRRVKNTRRLMVESTSIALLCMQDRRQEAIDRIYSLERLGVFGAPPEPQIRLRFEQHGRPSDSSSVPASAYLQASGPTNAALSEIFAQAVEQAGSIVLNGDWRGEMAHARRRLDDWTRREKAIDEGTDSPESG